jgi:hypothetical protein
MNFFCQVRNLWTLSSYLLEGVHDCPVEQPDADAAELERAR